MNKRNFLVPAALLAAAVLAGLGVATATVGQSASAAEMATTGQEGHRHYVRPAEELAAARACYRAEREARGIPADLGAYVTWWHAHEGTQLRADWSAAYEACQATHLVTAKWDWASMVRVAD